MLPGSGTVRGVVLSYYDHAAPVAAAVPEPVEASVTPWSRISPTERRSVLVDENWQAKIREYDRDGPGIVRAALDMPAAASMMLDLCVRRSVQCGTGHEIVRDNPLLLAILGLFRGDRVDQRHLFSRLLRSLDATGECYMIYNNPGVGRGRMSWQLAQTTNVTDNKGSDTVTVRTHPDARPGDRGHRTVPARDLYYCISPDPEWEDMPWSPLRAGIPHIDKWRLAERNMARGLGSQLVANGVLWAKATAQASGWQDQFKSWGHRAVSSDDGPEAVLPFTMSTSEKPEFLKIGRSDHAEQIAAADEFLKSFARSSDLPTQWLLEGPGSANHWADFIASDQFNDLTMQPRWMRAVGCVTSFHLIPILRALPAELTKDLRPLDDLEVWVDDTRLRSRTDNSDKIMELGRMGIANREALAECAGLSADQLLELPEGVSDFEAWLVSRAPGLGTRSQGHPGVQGLIDGIMGDDNPDDFDADRLAPGLSIADPGVPERPDVFDLPTEPSAPPVAAEVDWGDVDELTDEIVNELSRPGVAADWYDLVPT